jgi:hypothetical protein
MLNALALAIVLAGSASIAVAKDRSVNELRASTSATCTSSDEQSKCVCPGSCKASESSCECR